MRENLTSAELRLWSYLRGDQIGGFRFRRQHRIGEYIVDFYCARATLIVEVDGDTHDAREQADEQRSAYLRSRALAVLRFTNDEIFTAIDGVRERISDACNSRANIRPSPLPSPGVPGEGV